MKKIYIKTGKIDSVDVQRQTSRTGRRKKSPTQQQQEEEEEEEEGKKTAAAVNQPLQVTGSGSREERETFMCC